MTLSDRILYAIAESFILFVIAGVVFLVGMVENQTFIVSAATASALPPSSPAR